jgi:LacI family transcriptional regulator
MAATLQQIADVAGVTPMTVSRVLRGVGRISPETRHRIRMVAEDLGYQRSRGVVIPPPIRHGKADHALKILAPTVGKKMTDHGGAWYLHRMLDGLAQRLELSNGSVSIEHFPTLQDLIETWKKNKYHGVVLRQPLPCQWIEQLKAIGPVVYAVEFDYQYDVDCLYSNEQRTTAMILQRLTDLGHQQIGFLGVMDFYAPHQAIFEELDQNNLIDQQGHGVHGMRHASWAVFAQMQPSNKPWPIALPTRDWRSQSLDEVVSQGLEKLLHRKHPPTAIVCSCDPVALTVLQQLSERGIHVPDQMSLVSYGGSPQVQAVSPAITSASMPMEIIGRVIPELIERRLADPDAISVSMQFQTSWQEGQSISRRR